MVLLLFGLPAAAALFLGWKFLCPRRFALVLGELAPAPDPILRKLLFGDFTIHPERRPMRVSLLGKPRPESGA